MVTIIPMERRSNYCPRCGSGCAIAQTLTHCIAWLCEGCGLNFITMPEYIHGEDLAA